MLAAPSMAVDGALGVGQVRRVAVPGGTLAVEVAGQGPPLLLWHGWTLDRRQWRAQAPLARQFTLLMVDRRGCGQSDAVPDLAAEPDDIARVAETLGLTRYHLMGFSQGGKVALAHAAARPPGLERLVVIGTSLDADVRVAPDAVPLAEMAMLAGAGRLEAMRQLWLANPLTAATAPGRAALITMLAGYDGRDLVAPGRPLTVTLADVAQIAVPATALVGADDTPWRQAVTAALGQCGLATCVIPGGGHLAPIEAAAATNAAILAALAGD